MEDVDHHRLYRALRSRDRRFDGVFFVAVKSTGIYCRPFCPARPARRENLTFYRTAAEAERNGYRACLRCRPELAPGNAIVDALPRLVEAAVHRIAGGALNEGSVDALAASLGVSDRHLRRAMVEQLGVTPVELAQTGRLAFAKRLLHDSRLPVSEIAFAAGFQSLRRFNALFRARFGRAPTALRRDSGSGLSDGELRLRLEFRPPLAVAPALDFLAHRAIPGVEVVDGALYRRTVSLGGATGTLSVSVDPHRPALQARVSSSLVPVLMPVAARLRRLFDLDAQPLQIDAALAEDALLAPSVKRRPGLRVPGAFDGFETAVRAVLGQQISVKGARTLAGRLVARFGDPLPAPEGALTHTFPSAATLASQPVEALAAIGLPASRARTLKGLAEAVAGGLSLEPGAPVAPLRALAGFGEWTVQYLAMRALAEPDAFPASDLGVLRRLEVKGAAAAMHRARPWSPFRAYAVMHLWSSP